MQITGDHNDEYLIMSMISRHVLRLPVGRGGVINSPRSVFWVFLGVESWATAIDISDIDC